MTTTEQTALAILDGDGAIVEVGPQLPTLTVEQAESLYPRIVDYQNALKRLGEFTKSLILDAWKAREQREGILGGLRYERKPTMTPYIYKSQELFGALKPFVGKVITEDERIEAMGWDYQPPRTIPELVTYDPSTAKLDAFGRRSKEIAAVIEAHRSRESGPDRLVAK